NATRSGETNLRVTSSAISSTPNSTQSPYGATQNPAVPTTTQGSSPNTTTQNSITTQVKTTSQNDFWGNLQAALDSLVGTEGGRNVVITPSSGVVLVKAMPSEIRAVENYLRATQAIADRQVMLEAKIIQVTLNSSFQAGVNWASFNGTTNRVTAGNLQPGSSLSTTGTISSSVNQVSGTAGVGGSLVSSANAQNGTGFLGLALQTSNFAALLNFLETQGSVSVLSSPRVATLNNQKAVLKVGTDELYVTGVTTNTSTNVTGTATFSPSVTLQPYFSGIALDVTPQIDEDNNIILHIHPAVTTVQEKEKLIDLGTTFGSITLPLAASTVNESDSIVRARDGYIVAIGGLMSQTGTIDRSGLPGTTDSDVGGLFGQRSRTLQKVELVILLKPTLIKNPGDTQPDIDATTDRIEKLRN
ncbi:MAG TPA: secretin N-terminal domain-containing protein, partial [Rhodocyclaceae bacterium]|nr:secretin N-terminal domain-containing protein [Rhodocyclaceae bacterium]